MAKASARPSTCQKSTYLSTLLLVASLPLIAAQGDYTCQTTADCAAWASPTAENGPYPVSANMECVADPLATSYGYCGYAGATCTVDEDCDYGSCSSGTCVGYLGYTCASDNDCMGFFNCGTDKMCGGANSACSNGGPNCMSGSCSVPAGSDTAGTCSAPATTGQLAGAGCSSDSNCASGMTCSGNICATKLSASARARSKFRRGTDHHERVARAMSSAYLTGRSATKTCPKGQTACAIGLASGSSNLGFECIDTLTTLESCGGCLPVAGLNEPSAVGIDCTTLPNVRDVSCDSGRCRVGACIAGTSLNPDGLGCL